MSRQPLQQWKHFLAATLVAGAAIAATTSLGGAAGAPTFAFAQLADVPSHDERYTASLIPAAGAWTLEVRTTDGAPVEGAALRLESWMPDDGTAAPARPRVTAALGGGRYRVEGVRLDRPGWWNVKLEVSSPAAGTDSLAFNLVL